MKLWSKGFEPDKLIEEFTVGRDRELDLRLAKYDVEGSELQAIMGSAKTIKKYSPDLCVSLYHKSEDIFFLPALVHHINPEYKFYLRRGKYLPAWDINLIAVK